MSIFTQRSDIFTLHLVLRLLTSKPYEASTPSEYYNQQGCDYPQAACPQKSGAAGPVVAGPPTSFLVRRTIP